jgi:hypothetical protein
MTTKRISYSERNRPFMPGEIRAFPVPQTSAVVTLQRVDNGLTGQPAYVVMVRRAGVLDDELRASFSHEGAARRVARAYARAEYAAVVGVEVAIGR